MCVTILTKPMSPNHMWLSGLVAKVLGSHDGLGLQLICSLRTGTATRFFRRIGTSCNAHQVRPVLCHLASPSPVFQRSGSEHPPMAGWSTSSAHLRVIIGSMRSERRAHGRKAAEGQRHNLVWHMQHPTSHHSIANLQRPNLFPPSSAVLSTGARDARGRGDPSGAVRSTGVHPSWQSNLSRLWRSNCRRLASLRFYFLTHIAYQG